MFRTCLVFWFTTCGLVGGTSPGMAEPMRAGVARIDITPPLDLKASLGGYGARMSQPAEGIHDRLFAKALVWKQGDRRFALVTADLLGFPPPLRAEVAEKLAADGWTSTQLMLLPSHSHTAIDMMQIHSGNKLPVPQLGIFHRQLHELIVDRLATVIQMADQHAQTVCVGTTAVALDGWNANRRCSDGCVDRQLTVTRVDTTTGEPLAVLVNWTAHPTIMAAEDMWYSGGWPGHLQRTLEALIGNTVTVLYHNGAVGDQRPVARDDSGRSRWERAERYGRELALECHRLWERTEVHSDVTFGYHTQAIPLPAPAAHSEFMLSGGSEYGLTTAIMNRLLATMMPSETVSTSLQVSDLVIVGIPGEMTAGLGQQIRRETQAITAARHVVIGGLANEWISYILTADEYEAGGYESSVSFFGPALGSLIREGAIAGVRQLVNSGR